MAAKFLKKSSHEPNLQDKSSVYTGIHLLFGRKDSHNHPGWKEAINKERDELLSRKEPTHVGRLTTNLSVEQNIGRIMDFVD